MEIQLFHLALTPSAYECRRVGDVIEGGGPDEHVWLHKTEPRLIFAQRKYECSSSQSEFESFPLGKSMQSQQQCCAKIKILEPIPNTGPVLYPYPYF